MKKYDISIIETLERTIEGVEAKSLDQAIEYVRQMYAAEKIILDGTDSVDVSFEGDLSEEQ